MARRRNTDTEKFVFNSRKFQNKIWICCARNCLHSIYIGEGKATHSSVLAWRIPGKAEPGGLPSMGSHRVGHDWSNLAAAAAVLKGEALRPTGHFGNFQSFSCSQRWEKQILPHFEAIGFPGGLDSKESACNAGDLGLIPGLGSPGEGKGYPLQNSGLENSMDRGAWRATVHGVAKSQAQLNG